MTMLVNRGRTAGLELQDLARDIAALAMNPPARGYGDGYDVVHIVANLDENTYDFDMIDRADPLRLEVVHAKDWEEIVPEISRFLDWFESGATQGFVVLRHDPQRYPAPSDRTQDEPPQDVALCPDCNGSGEQSQEYPRNDCFRCRGEGTVAIENLTTQERVDAAARLLNTVPGFSVMFDPRRI